jgi:D-beta-D-heptose 7-phosphate kinase/D-beta-D-heptose 1-phosphate adenosyltransferase
MAATRLVDRLKKKPPPHAAIRLPELKPLRIVVAGEMILDCYLWGGVSRISPEAPIPILKVTSRDERPGNAGFVMANLRALGAEVSALSVLGDDRNGRRLREILAELGVRTDSVVTDPTRPTTLKQRMLGSVQSAHRATQQLLRVDLEDSSPLAAKVERAISAKIARELRFADAVLVSDIDKGILTPAILRGLIAQCRKRGIPLVADPRVSKDYSLYRGATALTPNRYETEIATGVSMTGEKAWREAARKLIGDLGLSACLITLDRDGIFIAERGGAALHIPTAPRAVYDVTGAGDVVLAVFGLFYAAGLRFAAAAALANLAAGIEVSRLGAEVVSRADLIAALEGGQRSFTRKIMAVDELKEALERDREAGRKVAFTNGCFDLLHSGHVESLNFARAQADALVVGVNSDRAVRALKGEGRPIYAAADRVRMLAALECVDYVVVFDDTRAEKIIRELGPDVLVKGADWRGKRVDGGSFVKSRGGRVVLAPLLPGHATSNTVKRIRSAPR